MRYRVDSEKPRIGLQLVQNIKLAAANAVLSMHQPRIQRLRLALVCTVPALPGQQKRPNKTGAAWVWQEWLHGRYWRLLPVLLLMMSSTAYAASLRYIPDQGYALSGRVVLAQSDQGRQQGLADIHFHIRHCLAGQLSTRSTTRHCRQWSVRGLHPVSDTAGYWWVSRLPAGYYRIEVEAKKQPYRIHPARVYQWTNGHRSPLLRFYATTMQHNQ